MEYKAFAKLTTLQVAEIVRENGPKVCVFPINGTRRWFMLEHATQPPTYDAYLKILLRRYVELFELIFAHGITTLLVPSLGIDLMERGDAYVAMVTDGLRQIAHNEMFLNFYDSRNVCVRFYGAYREALTDPQFIPVIESIESITHHTATHTPYRLFFGLFANDAAVDIAKISIEFFQNHGRVPERSDLIKAYYGAEIEPADIFIGFDKPAVFDMPLISLGEEDLYFTVAPSPYMTPHLLRAILYDHIYGRHVADEYTHLTAEDLNMLKSFYRANKENALGIGRHFKNVWYPMPQVVFPTEWADSDL